jgi:hypothetical protein
MTKVQDEAWESQRAVWDAEAQRHKELEALARICPICKKDVGEADFTPDDPSVGIFGFCWGNECPVHGLFWTDSEGVQELEESS